MSYLPFNVIPAKKGKKKKIKKKFDKQRMYSSFWLDKDDLWGRDLKNTGSSAASTVKLIKLRSYHRAVSNFVKILTNKEIPVVFHNGSDSFTDGKCIAITSKIDTKNFDVVVGLALHEASHVLLTDFQTYANYSQNTDHLPTVFKNVVNWIEDRRIDNYVFKTSPGYKAYYHKLYDHYFNSEDAAKIFISKQYREVNLDSYMAHIINMTNPAFNPTALPGLEEIVKVIDLSNIGRLKNTYHVCLIADQVLNIIYKHINNEQVNKQQTEEPDDNSTNTGDVNATGMGSMDSDEDTELESIDSDADTELEELTDKELADLRRLLDKQEDFINHRITENGKVKVDKKMQKRLEGLNDVDVEVEKAGDKYDVLVYNMTKNRKFFSLLSSLDSVNFKELEYKDRCKMNELFEVYPYALSNISTYSYNEENLENVFSEAITLGNQLGKKLRLVNETRELVYNRLEKGAIDKRRVSCLGYDISNVFSQRLLDSYKSANLHLSLDASGSMDGEKWRSTVKMVIAIAVAARSTNSKINVQISLRCTSQGEHNADVIIIYDSKVNTIDQLCKILRITNLNSVTPEGLCFEAMYKRGLIKPSDSEQDSYFINISDGQPSYKSYYGKVAVKHTKTWVNKIINNLNVHMLSYFVSTLDTGNNLDSTLCGKDFKEMYGKDARGVNPNSLVELAKTMNDKFLAAKVNH